MRYTWKEPDLRGGTQTLVEERRRNGLSKLSLEVFLLEVHGKRLSRGERSRLAWADVEKTIVLLQTHFLASKKILPKSFGIIGMMLSSQRKT